MHLAFSLRAQFADHSRKGLSLLNSQFDRLRIVRGGAKDMRYQEPAKQQATSDQSKYR